MLVGINTQEQAIQLGGRTPQLAVTQRSLALSQKEAVQVPDLAQERGFVCLFFPFLSQGSATADLARSPAFLQQSHETGQCVRKVSMENASGMYEAAVHLVQRFLLGCSDSPGLLNAKHMS